MIYGYDLALYEEFGVRVRINLNENIYSNALITGSSGSGKSLSVLYLIGSLLQSAPETIVFICDFKNSNEFNFLSSYEYYYQGENCYQGIMEYYSRFVETRKEGINKRHVIVVDEYPALLIHMETMDKLNKTHQAKDILSAISSLLMMGRGVGYGVFVTTQRADSSWFSSGSRQNFMVICVLGRLYREEQLMLMSGEIIPDRIYQPGQGLLLADGQPLREVIFPWIKDLRSWKHQILRVLDKNEVQF